MGKKMVMAISHKIHHSFGTSNLLQYNKKFNKLEVQKKKKKEENKIESGFLKFFVVGIADVF